jgi:hypothetical protein
MNYCVNCGHELGVGRYCTNCGHPVDSPVDTAERPRVTPAEDVAPPPPTWTPAPPARYPLFADEQPAPAYEEQFEPTPQRRTRPWGMWAAIAIALLLVLVLGVALLTGGDDDGGEAPTADDPTSSAPNDIEPSSDAPDVPKGSVTADAQVTVPATAAPGRTVDGTPVDYEAENMLDGVPETAWRMAGDGSGSEIVLTLPEETRLRSVGLINGYAKEDAGRDWYHGNRRIEQVEWVFDDGTTVPQTLGDTTGVQSIDVDATTTTITLRLLAVSAPGTGPDSRDFTAISDLLLVAGT